MAKFQAQYLSQIPIGDRGLVGPTTRKKLNALSSEALAKEEGTPAPVPCPQKTTVSSFAFARNLVLGNKGEDVKQLQIFLNNNGFIIAAQRVGSKGNETDYFGALTKAALVKFQDTHQKDILAPVNLAKGTGFFGPSTRKKIQQLQGL